MSSSVVENYQYDPEVDIVLYVCALAFRRSIADYESFGAWYNSPQALVRFHADAEDLHGTLYSFRRNFAHIINDSLSKTTASTLMGHTPNSYTLKNAYAGRFEDLNMTRLIHTSRTETTDTANSIITPSTFRIKDIRQYALTDEELETVEENATKDLRLRDIQALISLQSTALAKNICEWCKEEGYSSKEYRGATELAKHLYESQASKDTCLNTTANIDHTLEYLIKSIKSATDALKCIMFKYQIQASVLSKKLMSTLCK
ncbi:hypothetical protein HPULCUR_008259 [Helicostylum pulchrum]|uniref:Uncharacterized protein n=1 Tax=Helicostylum pulchrum TaxID=562976 RepID=A0ABP9Y727_9FUNG